MNSGGSTDCLSRVSRDAIPKPVSRTSPLAVFTRMLAGLMSLWIRPRWCTLPRAAATPTAMRRKPSHLHRRAEEPAEQLAAGILEHQNGTAAISHKLERPHRPIGVQLILEGVFVGKAIEGGRCRLLRGWEHDQHTLAPAFCAVTPPSAEDESAILRQNFEATNSVHAEPRRWPHSRASPLSRLRCQLCTTIHRRQDARRMVRWPTLLPCR